MLKILEYDQSYLDDISKLFYETVHTVNVRNYTDKQLSVWAESADSLKCRCDDLQRQKTLIAFMDGEVVGFGSIDGTGYLDLLFVHKNYQRKGIATALCCELEKGFDAVTVYASLTAKPFFEKRGYVIVKEQEVERNGVKLKNLIMKKYNPK